jgi:psp operon transcriptional activator
MAERANLESIGESDCFLKFNEQLSRAAKIDRSVLIIGERGTGKELAAQKLHMDSSRWEKPLVTLNCAALPPSLIESELFGYQKGAFTGASANRKGRFEEADGGTLFLDEIGLIPLEVQEKILRVVEYGTFSKVGSSEEKHVDVRIIGATNNNLQELVNEGKFKADLLDRLSFEVFFVPPLRYRDQDIELLASYFAAQMARECDRGDDYYPYFSEEVLKQLNSYSWPGNVRELKNVVERAVYQSDSDEITKIQLDPFFNPYDDEKTVNCSEKVVSPPQVKESDENDNSESNFIQSKDIDLSRFSAERELFEIEYLRKALDESNNNQRLAAEKLGLSYDQLRGLYRKYKVHLSK